MVSVGNVTVPISNSTISSLGNTATSLGGGLLHLGGSFGPIVSELVVIALIVVVLFVVFAVGKSLLKLIFGLITNSILGVVALFLLDYIFGIGIPLTLPVLLPVALFGLPGLGTIIILKLLGVAL